LAISEGYYCEIQLHDGQRMTDEMKEFIEMSQGTLLKKKYW
jgi:hypothetical protein